MILTSASWLPLGLSISALVAYLSAALATSQINLSRSRGLTLLAWVLHGLVLAWGLMGQSPTFGFAPALSVTAWLVVGGYAIESHVYPQLQERRALSAIGIVTLLLAMVFPGSPLSANASPWLPLHWALGIASYGLFAAAAGHAWLMNRTEDRIRTASAPSTGLPLLTLERLTFRFVGAGFALLSATLLVAIVFMESLYGPGAVWKWDHKTIFSILSWVTFAVLIVGRIRLGWRGRTAARLLYVGTGLLLLAYVGSRFVIEIVLNKSA